LKLIWHHGFGVLNAETKTPVTDSTVFEAASLSKPVFAYAVLKLVDAGKVDLDKPLNQYLPGNYDVGDDPRLNQISTRRVLSHTTGFPIGGQMAVRC
jgi:CubicO group peptidase (beta-lactamase class C family)